MKWKLDSKQIKKDELVLNGWAVGDDLKTPLTYSLTDRSGREIPFAFTPLEREDITRMVAGKVTEDRPGFDIRFPFEEEETYCLTVSDGKSVRMAHVKPAKVRAQRGREQGFLYRMEEYLNPDRLREFREYAKEKGLGRFFLTAGEKTFRQGQTYDRWYRENVTPFVFQAGDGAKAPRFQICLYGSASSLERHESRRSIRKQNYPHYWIKEDFSETGSGAKDNAWTCADGDYLLFLPEGGVLSEDCLSLLAEAVRRSPEAGVFYGDEDLESLPLRKKRMPFFKPDFSPAMMREIDYLGDLLVVSVRFLKETGLLFELPEAWADEKRRMVFRMAICQDAGRVVHIPHILFHGRDRKQVCSYAEGQTEENRLIRRDALKGSDEKYGLSPLVRDIVPGEVPGSLRTIWEVKGNPKISILIPTKDHVPDLELCVRSLLQKSTWQNFEILLLENNSTEEETFACYRRLQEEDPRVRLLVWEKGFNFSAINNFGASKAQGEYLLFLNNDVEVVSPDFLEEMLGFAQQPDVGAVGARLLFPDGTLQHAGVFVGMSGLADHGFQGFTGREPGYHFRPLFAQDLSAVTAACMMMKTDLFREIGGYDEAFEVAFNDTDLCMRIRKSGHRIIYTPHAVLNHYESKSRGLDASPEKRARLNREIARFREKWGEELGKGDPFYNPNLTLERQDFTWMSKNEREKEIAKR